MFEQHLALNKEENLKMNVKTWAEKTLKKQIKRVKTIMVLQSFFSTIYFTEVLSGCVPQLLSTSVGELPLVVRVSGALMLLGAFASLIFGGYSLVLYLLIIVAAPKNFLLEKKAQIKQKFKGSGGKQ